MIRYLKKAIPLSILASGIMASASFADTFTLRVGSGHPSKPTAYVTNMEQVLVPTIKKRVAAETNHKVRIIEASIILTLWLVSAATLFLIVGTKTCSILVT